eukprot:9485402-Pyramimonas_sp.AAC.1
MSQNPNALVVRLLIGRAQDWHLLVLLLPRVDHRRRHVCATRETQLTQYVLDDMLRPRYRVDRVLANARAGRPEARARRANLHDDCLLEL